MAFKYCTATNTGKGFITHKDSSRFSISGYPGDVWVLSYNHYTLEWINRVNGTQKTKEEAQTIVDTQITNYQSAWDGNNVEGETAQQKIDRLGARPTEIVLPQL